MSRVSIPGSVRKTIQNIKEITGNHSDEEIYAMLRECSMDPNETAQKLLFQDTFHEVKRKRDRKKETLNQESPELRWKPGMQGRGNRVGRGNYSTRMSHEAVGGRNSASGKENGTSQEVGVGLLTKRAPQDKKHKEGSFVASSSVVIPVGPDDIASDGPAAIDARSSAPSPDLSLIPSQNSIPLNAVGTNRNEVGRQRTARQISVTPTKTKSTIASSERGSSIVRGETPSKSEGVVKSQLSESSQPGSATQDGSSVSRPSSNYSSRSQKIIAPPKVSPTKEWKPKPTNPNLAQGSGSLAPSEVPAVAVEANTQLQSPLKTDDTEEATSELEWKLDNLHISDNQHVIIPNHLHVPDAEKLGFRFGSFDASFSLNTSYNSERECDKSPPISEYSEEIEEESVEEQLSSIKIASPTAEEGDYSDQPPSSSHVPESSSPTEVDISSSMVSECTESKQETPLLPGGHQHSGAHNSPNYSIGLMPPMLGSQLAPFESIESQTHDSTRLPTYVVQQPFDPASYYAQFYRSGGDSDGRISPFHSVGAAAKHNGNVAVASQASQSPQEAGNPLLLSTAGPTPIAVSQQQPLPVYRQPAGMHLPHYPPNYIPYGHYFPYFVPPPAIHQYLSAGSFPQQPQLGGVYPAPSVGHTKYSPSQYKPGSNEGNSTNFGVHGSYGPYTSSPASYNPTSVATGGNPTSNEDVAVSQFKESNVYVTGPQSEGTGVWFATPGRDISGLQPTSFYNFPQGQVAFAPAQAGIYHHPSQPVNAASVQSLLQHSQNMANADPNNVYQQSQPAQINWPSNY